VSAIAAASVVHYISRESQTRRRREMYIGHARLCVCLSLATFPRYCTDPDVTWANGRGAP